MEGNIERVLDFSLERRSSYIEGEFGFQLSSFGGLFWPEKKETEREGSILREEKFSSRLEGTALRILEVFSFHFWGDLLAGKGRNREGRINLERRSFHLGLRGPSHRSSWRRSLLSTIITSSEWRRLTQSLRQKQDFRRHHPYCI